MNTRQREINGKDENKQKEEQEKDEHSLGRANAKPQCNN